MLSIPSHMCNSHTFNENKEYKQCAHGQLQATEEKPWLHEESLVNFSSNVRWIFNNHLTAGHFKSEVCNKRTQELQVGGLGHDDK